jgi:hypothetical protein
MHCCAVLRPPKKINPILNKKIISSVRAEMNTIISKDEVTDMLENAQFIIPSQTIKDLRDIWSESMKVQEEIG